MSEDGYILTNAHLVADMEEATVKLLDRREFKARIVGIDRRTDVALIKIEAKGLRKVTLGGYMGLSFAVPIDLAVQVADELRTRGKAVRGRLGVRTQEVTPQLARAFGLTSAAGALVLVVERASPAEKAGIVGSGRESAAAPSCRSSHDPG